ncbi:MAG: glycosyltransferase [Alphaproteobacteria bacterium]|nr:glycosyltransferase [Alphaproteobacteria bacterium]
MVKISVVVPIYNVELYLSQCLENIVNQTYKNLEIILVNDGSRDSSIDICRAYAKKDKRIKYIYQQNMGLSAARNTGIKNATGDYIHFIDSDDYIPLDYYEKMISALGNTDADIVCSGFYFEKHPNESVDFTKSFIYTNINDKIQKTFAYKYKYVWRYLIKRSFVEKQKLSFMVGYYMEDIMFTLPAFANANKIVTVPNAQYFYRHNNKSILNWKNRKKNRKLRHDTIYMYRLARKYAKEHNFSLKNIVVFRRSFKLFSLLPIIKEYTYTNKTVYTFCGIRVWEKR